MCSSIVEKILKLKGIEKWSASDCKLEQVEVSIESIWAITLDLLW